ncbi:hypothetical protein LVD15_01005 [Fulvivirga maritima]|uniref:hypothetical protein n=1 Tax=Fulvivirga maritima TaxID=2904247 RepID=UPI001F405EB0|nr:hypothetical protein [Fulvivirga maritima]UII27044.1 hypothetical protein LVD15_01005 [Fulvivirga maritima]
MAKRKNPLSDLDAFLKQEASSLVNPDAIKNEEESNTAPAVETKAPEKPSKELIIKLLLLLAEEEGSQFQDSFYDIIKSTQETLGLHSSEDKMLMNTILYLQNKPNWKESIADYWSKLGV